MRNHQGPSTNLLAPLVRRSPVGPEVGCGESLRAGTGGGRTQPSSCVLFTPSLGTSPVAAASFTLFLTIPLTHSSASDLILVPQDMAGEMDPSEVGAPQGDISTVNQPDTGRGT